MTNRTKQIIDNMNGAGQFSTVSWNRTLKTRAGIVAVVVKSTTCTVRSGIDYANLSSVKTAIAEGDRGAVESLPWGQWLQFPVCIGHKGKEYIRLYPANGQHPQTVYTIDGQQATKEQVALLVLASEVKTSADCDCFTIGADNILSVNGTAIANIPAGLAFKPVMTANAPALVS
jgi:hypothetical protein